MRTRVMAYGAVWAVLVSSVVLLLVTRREVDFVILRQPGTLYTTVTGGDIANFYTLEGLNRSGRVAPFSVEVLEPAGATVTILGSPEVPAYGVLDARLLVRVPSTAILGPTTPVRLAVRFDGHILQQIDSAFLGPSTVPGRKSP